MRAAGIYRRIIMLSNGRYAMRDDGMGSSLVPWKPLIEPRLAEQQGVFGDWTATRLSD